MSLTTVIFDFGGVLVRTQSQDRRATWAQRLGLTPEVLERYIFGAENGYAAQLGRISDEEHWRWIGAELGLDAATSGALCADYFADDVLDTGLLAYVDRLRGVGYHLGLLSNANDNARRLFRDRFDVLDHFDSVTISAEEGVMKPDASIYRIALARAGAVASDAVFVDDFAENVMAARRLGMIGVHFMEADTGVAHLAELTGVSPSDA